MTVSIATLPRKVMARNPEPFMWSTALPDWESRIVARQSLVPCGPLFGDEAEAALDCFRQLRVVDVHGQPTFGEIAAPWILGFVAAVFGSYNAQTGRRLIREFFLCVSKKNGKSTLAAGIMLTALLRNWRKSNELLILAPTIEAAQNSFKPAADMVRADPDLDADAGSGGFLHIQDHRRTITHLKTKATLKVVAADSKTVAGKKAGFVLVDELWEFGKDAGADPMLREALGGLVSRPEGFVISITTQSDSPPSGVFAEKLDYARKVRDGKVEDRKFLPVIYEFPQRMIDSAEHVKPENFYVTNPNLGASVSQEWLEDEMRKELEKGASTRNTFLAKHLNVQIGMSMRADGWAGAEVWSRGIEYGLTLDVILERCEVVTIGIDGGGLDDLLGVALIGRERGTKRWLVWAHALISDIGIERRKANTAQYDQFERDGDLTKFAYLEASGDALPKNIRFVVDLVERVKDAGLLAQVGVDAAGIGAIVDALADIGVTQDAKTLDAVRQGIALMGAVKTCEIKLADYSFRHGDSPMLKWCVGNLRVVPTPTAMRVARDDAGFGKIDPAMAMFNAAHLMCLNPDADGYVVEDDFLAL